MSEVREPSVLLTYSAVPSDAPASAGEMTIKHYAIWNQRAFISGGARPRQVSGLLRAAYQLEASLIGAKQTIASGSFSYNVPPLAVRVENIYLCPRHRDIIEASSPAFVTRNSHRRLR